MSASDPSSDSSSTSCRLLALPPDLRNYIYELAFSPASTPADLLTCAGPSESLLLTCRQIAHEAKALHKTAYHRFWTETKFEATFETSYQDASPALDALKAGDINSITNVTLFFTPLNSTGGTQIFTLHHSAWLWEYAGRPVLNWLHRMDDGTILGTHLSNYDKDGTELAVLEQEFGRWETLTMKEQITWWIKNRHAVRGENPTQ